MLLTRWFPFLAWPRLTWALARNEFPAGLTCSLMLLPQGVAYAALAGMPLVTGIYASLLPALIAVLWSASPRLGVGPTALTCLLISSSLTGMAEPGSAHWVALAAWMAIMAGVLQWLIGLLRGGWVLNLVTSPVLNGFTQAAGVLILLSQLPSLLGLRTSWHAVWQMPSIHHFDVHAAGFGLGGLAILLLSKKFLPRVPAAVLAVGICGLVSWAIDFSVRDDGVVVGHLPSGLPTLALPGHLTWDEFVHLLLPMMVVGLVSFLEVASSAQIEHRRAGTRWDENQDLMAQGMAKVACGLSGSFAISASFSRSAVALHAGARSGWATVFSIALVLAAVLWLTPLLYHVPKAVLAAVVVSAVVNLIQPRTLFALLRISRTEGTIAIATFGLTLATAPDLYGGVLAGVLMSLCLFLYHRLHPRIVEISEHPDGSLRSRQIWQLPHIAPDVMALRMDAGLDFASAPALERYLTDALAKFPQTRIVFLDAQPINRVDLTGIETFIRLRLLIAKHGAQWHISGLKLPVQQALERAQALQPGTDLHLHRTPAQAIAILRSAHNH